MPDEIEAVIFDRPDGLTDAQWSSLRDDIEAYADQRYARLLRLADYKPHLVKHDVKEGAERDLISDCPDCTKGLVSEGTYLICTDLRSMKLPLDPKIMSKLTWHDIIACGRNVHGAA